MLGGPRAGHRSHVADRDRRSGVRQPVRHRAAADQAGVGGDSAAGHRRGGRRRSTGEPCAPGEKGIMVLKRPFPGLTPALWGEPERYGRDYWETIPGRLLLRRLGARRRGRLLLVRRPRRRNHQDRRPPDRHDRSGERVPEASGRCRVRRRRPAGRDARRGHLGVRPAQARARGVRRAAPGAARHGPPRAGPGGGDRRAEFRRACCRRRAAARSCAAC